MQILNKKPGKALAKPGFLLIIKFLYIRLIH